MPALENQRHEIFAQALAKGKTQDEAYKIAGYQPSEPNASRLTRNDKVQARVAELAERGADRAEIDIARVLKELVRLGTSDIRDAFTETGALKPPKEWTDAFAASVASIEVVSKPGETDKDGNRTVEYVHKIKVWDKNSALEKIAKHLGMFIERVEVRTGPLEEAKPDELDRLREELIAERTRRATGGNGTQAGGKPH